MSVLQGRWQSKEYPDIGGQIELKLPALTFGTIFDIECTFYYEKGLRQGHSRTVLMESFAEKGRLGSPLSTIINERYPECIRLTCRSKKFEIR